MAYWYEDNFNCFNYFLIKKDEDYQFELDEDSNYVVEIKYLELIYYYEDLECCIEKIL